MGKRTEVEVDMTLGLTLKDCASIAVLFVGVRWKVLPQTQSKKLNVVEVRPNI